MAGIAGRRGADVRGRLAFYDTSVVTHCTAAGLQTAMTEGGRRPGFRQMTGVTLLGRRDVIVVFGGTGKSASGQVAGIAILWRSLEDAPLVAAFTADCGVCARQWKTCQAVINLRGSLRGRHVAHQQSPCEQDRNLQRQQQQPARGSAVVRIGSDGGVAHRKSICSVCKNFTHTVSL